MLGLLDFLRAVKGTLTLALRRVHPLVGAAAVAVLWVGALGAMFTLAREDPSSSPEEASSFTDHEGSADGSSTATSDHDGNGDGDDDAGWSQTAESTRTPMSTGGAGGDDGTTPSTGEPGGDLGAPSGSTPSTRPRAGTPDPSWATSSTTSTTTPPPGATTTTTTTPPSSGGNGGVLGGLLDLLGLGG